MSMLQGLRGPGSYNPPTSAPAASRPSPAFQDKQGRFDQPLQTLVPPVTPCPANSTLPCFKPSALRCSCHHALPLLAAQIRILLCPEL